LSFGRRVLVIRTVFSAAFGTKARALLLAGMPLLAAGGCTQMLASGQNANGVRMHQQGLYQGAVERFQQAIVTDPNNGDGYYNLAATYHQLGKQQNNDSYLAQAETY